VRLHWATRDREQDGLTHRSPSDAHWGGGVSLLDSFLALIHDCRAPMLWLPAHVHAPCVSWMSATVCDLGGTARMNMPTLLTR
jgi:hypothetical protein